MSKNALTINIIAQNLLWLAFIILMDHSNLSLYVAMIPGIISIALLVFRNIKNGYFKPSGPTLLVSLLIILAWGLSIIFDINISVALIVGAILLVSSVGEYIDFIKKSQL